MKMLYEVTVIIKKRSFPSLIDEMYKRDCELLELQHIEKTDEGYLYSLGVAAESLKRFEDFIAAISGMGEKYKIIATKSAIEERALGGLINVSSRMPVENKADFNTWVFGASGFIREQIRKDRGLPYTGISRSVGLVSGIKSGSEVEREQLLGEYAAAERDAVIINRFTGMNGYPITLRFDNPEDVVRTLKQLEQNFSALRVSRIQESTLMLYDFLFSELSVPVISLEHDEVPLYLFILIIKILLKYRLKPEETTIGFIGIDLSAIRLARVLGVIRIRRVLGFDQGEKNMLALENQGGLATTAENIFSNADITVVLKNNYNREELLKIRPGQFVISFMDGEELDREIISGKGVREFIGREASDIAVLFPGLLRGVAESGTGSISDLKLIEYSKKLVGFLTDAFEFPSLFSDIHDRVRGVIGPAADRK
jgi:hypothetical protein